MLPSTVIYSPSIPCLAAVIPFFSHYTTIKTRCFYNAFIFHQLHALCANRYRQNISNSIIFVTLRTLVKTMAGCTTAAFFRPVSSVPLWQTSSFGLPPN